MTDLQRAATILLALLLMLVVNALPEPSPVMRAGEQIALNVPHGKACHRDPGVRHHAVGDRGGAVRGDRAGRTAADSPSSGLPTYPTVVAAGFGNPLVTFFIGVLFLSTGFTHSGLGTRLVLHVLHRVGTRTDRVLLGFLVVGALLSMWITDMAVAAPAHAAGGSAFCVTRSSSRSRATSARALMISCAFGPLIEGHRHAGRGGRQSGRGPAISASWRGSKSRSRGGWPTACPRCCS